MFATLIIGLIAGPAVSLYGSPTVSPVTDAAWASEPLPPNAPSSISFFALSQAPPPEVIAIARNSPVTIVPISRPPSIWGLITPTMIGTATGMLAPALLYRAFWKRVGRLGVTVRVEPRDTGYRTSDTRDHLLCTLTVPGRVRVEAAKATLEVREGDWLSPSAPSVGRRYRTEVSLERVGERWQGRVPLASGGAPLFTFGGGECGLFWELTCELAVPQCPDLVVVRQLFARPV